VLVPFQQEPSLQIEVDLTKAQQYGVSPGEVRRAAATLLSGVSVGSLFDDQKVFEVVVRGTANVRNSPDSLRDLLIDTPEGGHVRLGDVANVAVVSSPANIQHDSVQRYIDVGAGIQGRDISAVTADIDVALAGMQLPLEYHAEVLGSYAAHQATEHQLLGLSIAALIAVLLLLQVAFMSWKLAGLAWLSLPAALTGGLITALAGGGVITLGALAGLMAVFGLAARSGIAQIRVLQLLERDAGQPLSAAQLRQAASQRLIPVMTTALAVVLAVTPLAILGPVAGNEILHSMALVIIGGVATATCVNLLVLPALYPLFAPAPQAATDWDVPAIGPAFSPVAN
jgi:Cu/Ag efflux pump CusA